MLVLPAVVLSVVGCVPRRPAGAPAAGGLALFQAKGCAHCHAIQGVGGHKGPDLTHVGSRLKPMEIRTQILEGGDSMPAYKEVLTAAETKGLIRYLHKLR